MRGDSLRDFYAKALALLGLAALAGVGALVDYWPTATDTSNLARTSGLAVLAPEALPPAPAIDTSLTTTPAASVSRSVWTRASLPAAPPTVTPAVATGPDPADTEAPAAGLPVALAVSAVTESSLGATEVALAPPPPAPQPSLVVADVPEDLASHAETPHALAAPVGGDNSPADLVTDAFKKTGQSIVRTGAKAGTSIVGALRVVTDAFKKVPWF